MKTRLSLLASTCVGIALSSLSFSAPVVAGLSASALSANFNQAHAAGRLTVYCTALNVVCEKVTQAFAKKYNVRTTFIRNASGATLAKVVAEKDNPQGDIIYGGTYDPHTQASELGLLTPYNSVNKEQILPRFQDPTGAAASHAGQNTSTPFAMGILGWAVNLDRLKKLGIDKVPTCWADLLDPRLKDEVQTADPQSSGMAYSQVATLVQLFGEEKGFAYMKKLHVNVNQYAKSGVTPPRSVARGETTVGIAFIHDHLLEQAKGAPIQVVVPCEGTGYDLHAVSIIKGARNLDNAKLFVDFALSKEGQEVVWRDAGLPQFVTNVNAEQSPQLTDVSKYKLIDYDFKRYGSDDEPAA